MGPPRNAGYDAPPLLDSTRLLDLVYRGAEWRIAVYCPQCMRTSKLDPAELTKKIGPNATIADLRARLRCKECGRSWDLLLKPALRSRRPARG
jgi:transposase-like protein